MLQVKDDHLVVEEKGIYSIEKFLVARKIMYWQVYLHKTVLAAELMLIGAIKRAKELFNRGALKVSGGLKIIFENSWENGQEQDKLVRAFLEIDDHDIVFLLKNSFLCDDYILRTLSKGLIQRRLFALELAPTPHKAEYIEETVANIAEGLDLSKKTVNELSWSGSVRTDTYSDRDEIKILLKEGKTLNLSGLHGYQSVTDSVEKFYFCHIKY